MTMQRVSRSDVWVCAVLAAIGTSIAAIAGTMIWSWHTGEPISIAGSTVERVQYDTAWVFVFCGMALALQAVGQHRAARLCAAVPMLLGVLRFTAVLLPMLSVRPMLGNPWLPLAPGDYDDMSLLISLVSIVTGGALASFGPRTGRRRWHAIAVALLASVALALSLLMVVGTWGGGTGASELLQLTSSERTSALLFIVLAATMLAYALLGDEEERSAVRRTAPLIVWLAAFVCALVLWRALGAQEARYIERGTILIAADARGQILRELNSRIEMIERLGRRELIYPASSDMMQRDAELLLQDVEELRSVAWAGPDYITRWVTPGGNGSAQIGYDLRRDPQRPGAAEAAVAARKTALSKFAKLPAGGEGVMIYTPVYEGDELRGILATTLGKGNWLKSLLVDRFPDHHLELIEDGKVELEAGSTEPVATREWGLELPLPIQSTTWTLRVTPSAEYLRTSTSRLPDMALALGTLMATLLALSTYLFLAARSRARALDRVNARLTQDIARRYHAEQELRESESRTRLIINAVKDCAIFMLSLDGAIATWNNGAQALNGYAAEEVVGRHFSMLYAPDREQPQEKELVVAVRRGWYEEECWHLRKDGTRFRGDDIISAIRDEKGSLRGFSMITRDVTPRLELRQQTERARDFYMALFAGFPNLVWRSDAGGTCDYLNQAWLDYTGRRREAELGVGWLDGVHVDDRPRWQQVFDLTFPAREPFELEFRLRRADGHYGWIICVGRPYHDMEGNFAGYLCSCYDNTARRAMEDALKESEERYERITANVPGMVFKLNRDIAGGHQFAYVSQGCRAVTGLEEAEIAGDAEAFFGLIGSSDRTHLLATLDESAARLTTWSWAGRLHPRHETAERWITIRAMPRRASDGTTFWDGVVLDDTQSRLAQLEIERSREELRELSRHLQTVREEEKARIAREVHDELGAMLSVLKMDLEWLGEHGSRLPGPVEKKRLAMIQVVDGAVAATRRIVTDLRPSVLDDLGLAAALRWQADVYQRHGKVRFHLKMPEKEIAVDREGALALFRIFQETATNVSRHAKASNVWVQLNDANGAYVLTVRDDGVGISDADVRKPTSHGLRGVRERAQQLGGDVSISGSASAGTTLVVSIPRRRADA
ncbi:MAG TPA: PAS domain S-box protein [Casimicrobiaceae bacterium]|nr:PAS domain S-box protein [Casimicrobiaceae bacterium]